MTPPVHPTGPDTRRARWSWRDTAVVVGIVAAGIGAAWALPHGTPADETASTTPGYVTEPVTYPVEIPGCDEVGPPPKRDTGFGWTAYGASSGYSDPDFPWLTATKATAMTDALRGALPPDVEVRFDAPSRMLVFQPIFRINPDTIPDGADVGGSSEARGTLLRAGSAGRLDASVREWNRPVPACVAGELDERRTLPDGTVVDVLDTWSELRGTRTLARAATAYPPDGSRVIASLTDQAGSSGDGGAAHSGALPLTVDELAAIAADPGLRTTTAVPAGTAPARMDCGGGVEPMGDPLDRGDVDRLAAALTMAWAALGPLAATPDRPVGSVEVAGSARDAACLELALSGPAGAGRLGVTIAVNTSAPEEFTAADALPDGTRVRTTTDEGTTWVTAVRPSGTAVTVTLSGAGPTPEQLVALATAPGLDL
ncbi:hypothetical protein GCM10023094_16880 [Rhodococcus olei]|uniref:Uncharacterized protein n=1 Tax=Rhodococcus olei TaxID=2161675 RepID=A0ABP8NZW2_9NOCA